MNNSQCVCGLPATVIVAIEWANDITLFNYCSECAAEVTEYMEDTTIMGIVSDNANG
jgi:hypothetical protein